MKGILKTPFVFAKYLFSRTGKAAESEKPTVESLGFSLSSRPYADNGGDTDEQGASGKKTDISVSIDVNLEMLKKTLSIPANGDIVLREFVIPYKVPVRAAMLYVEGLVNSVIMNQFILEPLMLTSELTKDDENTLTLAEIVEKRLLPNNQVMASGSINKLLDSMLMGTGLLIVDGLDIAFAVESKGWEHRNVATPQVEQVVRGPQEAFNEVMRVNTALIRRRIRTPRLMAELITIGRLSKTSITVLYMKGITNEKLVKEVKRRISGIDIDFLPDSGYLEQFIEDSPISIIPQTISTERPDRAAAYLSEGNVVIIVDNSPFAIVVPAIFTSFFQSPEDYYMRWPFGLTMRLIRVVAMFIALFLPGIYVAITTFHQEMIPSSLLYAIASSREIVPFPVLAEVLVMEGAFELIREAGIRIPSAIGPTIGIVGALILGQAAVQAAIVSPILVIVIALTALGSFAVPSFASSFALRILRFPMTILAGILGFFGLAAGAFALVIHLVTLDSFGVPFMSTISPSRPSRDVTLRGPLWKMRKRPKFLRTEDPIRQEAIIRDWSPDTPERKQSSNADEED